MGRQLRIEYENAFYHVMSHGNGNQWIYKSDNDLLLFQQVLREVVDKYQVRIHTAVLMRNHYHILIETPQANLSRCIKRLNFRFARLLNASQNRTGSIFKDRYKAILIQKDTYYLNVLRYICQNPVRQGIVKRCEEYKGGFLNWLKSDEMLKYLYFNDIITHFSNTGSWCEQFVNWLNEQKEENPLKKKRHKNLLGEKNWLKETDKKIARPIREDIRQKREYKGLMFNPDLIEPMIKEWRKTEKLSIKSYIYFKYSGMTLKEISLKLQVKNEYALHTRIYRFKRQMKREPIKQYELNRIEKFFLDQGCAMFNTGT